MNDSSPLAKHLGHLLGCLTTAAQLSYDVLVCTGICLQDQGRYEELVAQNHVAVADTGDEDWREVEEGQLHDKVILYRFIKLGRKEEICEEKFNEHPAFLMSEESD